MIYGKIKINEISNNESSEKCEKGIYKRLAMWYYIYRGKEIKKKGSNNK